MVNQEIFIGVSAHKPVKEFRIPFHEIVCAGAIKNADRFSAEVLRDDIGGGTISEKNPSYNELTVHWWMYRHVNAEWIGLCHYRRLFNFKTSPTAKHPRVSIPFMSSKGIHRFGWDEEEIRSVLSGGNYDVFVCMPESDVMPGIQSIYDNHVKMGLQSTVDMLMDCIREKAVDYATDAEMYFGQPEKHMFNMMIMKREYFAAYSKWLFSILECYETKLVSKGSSLERACGFAGEHLLNVWIDHEKRVNNLRVGELQTVFVNCTDQSPSLKARVKAYVKYLFDVFFPYGTARRDKFKWKYMMQG